MKKTITIFSSICLVLLLTALPITKALGKSKKINPTPDKPITLKLATFFPSEKDIRQIYTIKWGEAITAATEGAIKFKYFPAGQLVKAKEMSDALQNGIIDANTWFVTAYTPEDYPFSAAAFMIPLAHENTLESLQGLGRDLQDVFFSSWEKHNIKRLWGMESSYGTEWFFKDPWDPKDLLKNFRKKRVRTPGIITVRVLLKHLGAEQVSMSAPAAYEAGQKGIIQGCIMGFSQYANSHTYEVFPYHMAANTSINVIGGCGSVFRLDLWNSLPADIQNKILDISKKIEADFFYAYGAEVDRLRAELVKKGLIKQYVVMDKETRSRLKKELDPLIDEIMGKKFPNKWPRLKAALNKYALY